MWSNRSSKSLKIRCYDERDGANRLMGMSINVINHILGNKNGPSKIKISIKGHLQMN
jgi:hypothetical protein